MHVWDDLGLLKCSSPDATLNLVSQGEELSSTAASKAEKRGIAEATCSIT